MSDREAYNEWAGELVGWAREHAADLLPADEHDVDPDEYMPILLSIELARDEASRQTRPVPPYTSEEPF